MNAKCCRFVVMAIGLLMMAPQGALAVVVTFNVADVAVYFDTPPSQVTVTTGQVIPGGFDNSAAGDEFTLSSLALDIDGDLDILAPDPTVFFDLQVRTATFAGGQIVFDGFDHTFDLPAGERDGGYIVRPVDPLSDFYLTTFAPGDSIGDGNDFVRKNPLWNVAVDEGGVTTNFQPNVDNYIGFVLDSGNYGYLRALWDPTAAGGAGMLTLIDGAYEDTGAPIVVPGLAPTEGDYNGDGLVNAADYTVWRDNFPTASGASVSQGDGNGDGAVSEADYTFWATRYGSGAALATSVPEPGAMALVATFAMGLLAPARRR